ncbi:MAG: DUF2065 domain-containing protein [Rhodobacteraceae bacterium]|nr:DUF2065 domain-containing protein [Paracoccaceae bacterium]
MRDLLLALGLMAVIEGLVLALAPLRFEDILKALQQLSIQQRRSLGLAVVTGGVVLVWLAKQMG